MVKDIHMYKKSLWNKLKSGFTLIELLIVMAVVGAIAGIVLVAINPQAQLAKGRDAARKSHIRSLANAFEQYYVTMGSYPAAAGTHCIGVPSSQTCWGDQNIPGSDSLNTMLAPFLKNLPQDPLSSRGWGDRYMYLEGSTSITGCDANSIAGNYIIWRPDKQPASQNDCQSMGYLSCCGTGGPCTSQGGYYCAYKLN